MTRTAAALTSVLLVVWIMTAAGFPSAAVVQAGADILQFDTMAPVIAPYTGNANPIRGVPGGGLPWTISKAKGFLRANGVLKVEVEGLVLADAPEVPVNLRLTNPVPNFRGLVSCLSKDSLGYPTTVNVGTDDFPTDVAGDAHIEAIVELPTPCIAPIVFVTSSGGAWFAATGQ